MVSLRRAHALLLGVFGVAILMLLAPSLPGPRDLLPAGRLLLVGHTPAHTTPGAEPNTTAASAPPPPTNRTRVLVAAPAGNRTKARAGGVPDTRDLYVAGHPVAHPERCPDLGRELALLVMVSSAPGHRAQRDAVRLTWGHYALRRDVGLVFVVGATDDPRAEDALREEDALWGDVVRGAWRDSYHNLTLKSVSMLEWSARYCPRARMLLKADDDVFVNVRALLVWARDKDPRARTLWGRVLSGARPRRDPKAKYYLPPEELAGAALPPFASGPAYALTPAAARALLAGALAPGSRFVRLEDVYITGVVGARAGVARRHEPRFHNRRPGPGACPARRRLALHDLRPHEMLRLWKDVMDDRTKC